MNDLINRTSVEEKSIIMVITAMTKNNLLKGRNLWQVFLNQCKSRGILVTIQEHEFTDMHLLMYKMMDDESAKLDNFIGYFTKYGKAVTA